MGEGIRSVCVFFLSTRAHKNEIRFMPIHVQHFLCFSIGLLAFFFFIHFLLLIICMFTIIRLYKQMFEIYVLFDQL